MSDYDAIHDGVKAYLGGCDLELPASNLMTADRGCTDPQRDTSRIDSRRQGAPDLERSRFFWLPGSSEQSDSSIPLDDPRSELAALILRGRHRPFEECG